MKIMKTMALLVAAACTLQACQNAEKKDNGTVMAADSTVDTLQANASEMAPEEVTFIQEAAVGGMMEVEAANMALQKSKNEKVKAFAQMMVKDHSAANKELEKLATEKGLKLPATFPVEQQKHLDILEENSDRGFDRQYMEMMVSGHIKTLELFRKAANSEDGALRTFASQKIPVLEMHYKEADRLNTSIQKEKINNGDDNANVERDDKSKN